MSDDLDLWYQHVPSLLREFEASEDTDQFNLYVRAEDWLADRAARAVKRAYFRKQPLSVDLFATLSLEGGTCPDRLSRRCGYLALAHHVYADEPEAWVLLAFAAALLGSQLGQHLLVAHLDDVSGSQREPHAMEARAALVYWQSRMRKTRPALSDINAEITQMHALVDKVQEKRAESDDEAIDGHEGASLCVVKKADGNELPRDLKKQFKGLAGKKPLKASTVPLDLMAEHLVQEFPWMEEVIEQVFNRMRWRAEMGRPWFSVPPLLLVGPPGCGKTRFARRLAELSGCGYQFMSVGGSSDNRMLAGTARGWASAQPCLPVQAVHRSGQANPIMIVDEVDKATGSWNGRVHDTLLGFLEPESAGRFFDECLLAHANLSEVSWILTANYLEQIPEALLSRLMVMQAGEPAPKHFESVMESVMSDLAKEFGVPRAAFPELGRSATRALKEAFARGISIRVLKRALTSAVQTASPVKTLH